MSLKKWPLNKLDCYGFVFIFIVTYEENYKQSTYHPLFLPPDPVGISIFSSQNVYNVRRPEKFRFLKPGSDWIGFDNTQTVPTTQVSVGKKDSLWALFLVCVERGWRLWNGLPLVFYLNN